MVPKDASSQNFTSAQLQQVCLPEGLIRGPFGGSLTKSEFVSSGYQVYEQRHAIYGTEVPARYFVSASKFHSMKRFSVQPGDFIVSCSGTIGKISRVSESSPPGIINQALLIIRLDKTVVVPEFFLQYFRWDYFQQSITESIQGGAMKNLVGMDKFKTAEVLLPNFNEQIKIAKLLSDADDLIHSVERLISKKQAIKQGIMQELLSGRTRLPGFDSPWVPCNFGQLLSYEQPGPYLVDSAEYLQSGVPVLTAGKTFILGYARENCGIYTEVPVIIFDDFTTATKYVDFPFKAKSSAMKILTAKPGVDLRWVFERMQNVRFYPVDHKRRWITEYSKIEILTPPLEEQRAIAGILHEADREIDLLKRRLEAARNVKQGLMQQLLTGRTRLPIEEVTS